MRGLLGRLGIRGGAVLALALLVLGVVAIARLAGGPGKPPAYTSDVPATSTVDPTTGDDGETVTSSTFSPGAYPDDGAVTQAASAFVAAWLRSDLSPAAWLKMIAPLTTEALAKSLEGVDPTDVPATRVVTGPSIIRRTDGFARSSTTFDSGTLVLELSKHDNKWLVDSVDWVRL